MTAEVAVLNKSAVALAADSAMSVGNTGKTYPTNKLFALTKHHPVGIMIYNNAEFMGVPWETIIKTYRRGLGRAHRPTVKAYAKEFIRYVNNATICTAAQQRSNLLRITADTLRTIAREADQRMEADATVAIRDVVAEHSATLREAGDAPSMRTINVKRLIRRCEDDINDLISDIFAVHVVGSLDRQFLHEALEVAIRSAELSDGYSGLVFAGFGEKEIFPSLVEVVTDGSVGSVVKADFQTAVEIGRSGPEATVTAFAQSEMVERFMQGGDPELLGFMQFYFGLVLTKVSRDVSAVVQGAPLTNEQRSIIHNMVEGRLDDLQRRTNALIRNLYVDPVLDIVRHLPKEELANMAEALVSLTSLKRRVSMEEESVGGPVDVAVVSKGDGFVWIKRKHYFDPSVNRSHFVRHSPSHTTVREVRMDYKPGFLTRVDTVADKAGTDIRTMRRNDEIRREAIADAKRGHAKTRDECRKLVRSIQQGNGDREED